MVQGETFWGSFVIFQSQLGGLLGDDGLVHVELEKDAGQHEEQADKPQRCSYPPVVNESAERSAQGTAKVN